MNCFKKNAKTKLIISISKMMNESKLLEWGSLSKLATYRFKNQNLFTKQVQSIKEHGLEDSDMALER